MKITLHRDAGLTVAFIGGDGAGKTTIAKKLVASSHLKLKYLYMGFSPQSSDFILPTSRLVLFLKRYAYRKKAKQSGYTPAERIPANYYEYSEQEHGFFWVTGRIINRFLEAWYRQLISLSYQVRGYSVVYDRYFVFDIAPVVIKSKPQKQPWSNEILYWVLNHLYPKPAMTIFLDVPSELLYERKRETSPDYLEQRRSALLAQGRKERNFLRVDASQPLDKVFAHVSKQVHALYERLSNT